MSPFAIWAVPPYEILLYKSGCALTWKMHPLAGHTSQSDALVDASPGVELPSAHGVHSAAPSVEYPPPVHKVQVSTKEPAIELFVPAAHSVQTDFWSLSTLDWYDPAAQLDTQSSTESWSNLDVLRITAPGTEQAEHDDSP